MITLTGRAAAMDAVCSAFSPPANNSTAATKPSPSPQTMRKPCGGLSSPMLSMVVMTSVPESDEVMNQVASAAMAQLSQWNLRYLVDGAVERRRQIPVSDQLRDTRRAHAAGGIQLGVDGAAAEDAEPERRRWWWART